MHGTDFYRCRKTPTSTQFLSSSPHNNQVTNNTFLSLELQPESYVRGPPLGAAPSPESSSAAERAVPRDAAPAVRRQCTATPSAQRERSSTRPAPTHSSAARSRRPPPPHRHRPRRAAARARGCQSRVRIQTAGLPRSPIHGSSSPRGPSRGCSCPSLRPHPVSEVLFIRQVPAEVPATEVLPPEVLSPEVLAPEILAPEVLYPEVLSPEVLAPEVLYPEVLAPEVLFPEVLAPEVQAPEAPSLGAQSWGPGIPPLTILPPEAYLPLTQGVPGRVLEFHPWSHPHNTQSRSTGLSLKEHKLLPGGLVSVSRNPKSASEDMMPSVVKIQANSEIQDKEIQKAKQNKPPTHSFQQIRNEERRTFEPTSHRISLHCSACRHFQLQRIQGQFRGTQP